MPNPRRVRARLGPAVIWVTAGTLVVGFGLLVNGCRINKLLGRSGTESIGPLAVVPALVKDSALAGDTDPRHASIEVTNGGRWSATNDSPWIDVIPASGSGHRIVTIALDPVGLHPGPHEGSVTVSAPESAADPVTVPVSFFIQQPILSIAPGSVSKTANSGNAVFFDTLDVRNSGTGPLVWTVSSASGWLTLLTVSGVGGGKIAFKVSSAGLREGTYKDTIVVTAVGAVGSPAKIPVTLKRRQH